MKYKKHNELMRETDRRFDKAMRETDRRFEDERDRRYSVENELRAMALRIKESADAKALDLEKESQAYKEARNDAMREQNLKETGVYATRDDLAVVFSKSEKNLISAIDEVKIILKPIIDHVAADTGSQLTIGRIIGYIVAMGVITGIIFATLNLVFK